jgi:hypothetical protein
LGIVVANAKPNEAGVAIVETAREAERLRVWIPALANDAAERIIAPALNDLARRRIDMASSRALLKLGGG